MNYFNHYRTFLLIYIFFSTTIIKAQDNFLGRVIDFKKTEIHISEILSEFAEQGITFSYKNDVNAEDKTINLSKSKLTLKEVLDQMAKESKLSYKVFNGHLIIKSKSKKLYTVSGFIYCAYSGEPLIAANLFNADTYGGTSTNNYGFYSLTRTEESLRLRCSYIGYKPYEILLNTANDTTINVYLEPDNILKEVTIKDENRSLIRTSQCSNNKLNQKNIESQTLVMGEKDVLKTIQLLPGIQPDIEGSTGLQIRGGSHSQNLILIDDVPIYNVDHAFGFFSIFNADAIKSVQLYKGAFPARFGGGVSSIIDVRMNEGNNEHFQLDFSAGIISSKIKIETPIIKHKTSLMVSARYAYLSLPLKLANSNSFPGVSENYGFSDIYAKINHKFSDRNRIYLSCFYGYDKYKKDEKIKIDTTNLTNLYKSNLGWNNFALAARWNYLISDRFFCNSTITYGGFKYTHKKYEQKEYLSNTNSITQNIKDTNYYSGIKDIGLKIDFDLPVNEKHYVRFGLNSSMNIYQPFMEGNLIMVSKKSDNLFALPEFDINYDTIMNPADIKSYSISAYIEDDMNITDMLKANIGFRYSSYYSNNKVYYSPEPRLSLRYLLMSNLSFKAGFSRISQNTHLLSSSFLVLPFSVWVPSNQDVKPLYSDQYSLACDYNYKNILDMSLEGFFKIIQNDILFKKVNNTTLSWETSIEQGNRRCYGLELMINKQVGKITGWLTYTLSKTERKFESVNNGNYFPFWLVRKHKISVTLNFKLNDFIDFSASWVFSSGVSGNSGYQELSPILFQQAISNNTHRDSWTLINKIPAYHKLDIGINFHKKFGKVKHTLSLGLNNAYARNNPLLISEYEGYLYLSKINLFMPFIQYSLAFK